VILPESRGGSVRIGKNQMCIFMGANADHRKVKDKYPIAMARCEFICYNAPSQRRRYLEQLLPILNRLSALPQCRIPNSQLPVLIKGLSAS
jgi:hypothetical protein